ncbi:molybdopterin molybdenumtransferase MoeA [Neisseria dentiae]|uniref:Molybdopterin molybdenumtransferase n=1 Tax=Neisseria dentiae TaxID=194197 RepID=A0A1X3D3A6_9NEIS|nr:gephyrin-like molybdotransferase Glp [Neisseria dentiae]OSI14191.1 molybdopterin molybdenumtransferase MoeA [Neisseria dentiae]QMT45907.1 molybdopterin molybdotransferase MoeA [Neisseria dentiae]STZ51914.1 Molybdopterin molybdenumtransferase [Neisseria dentiae]
MIDFDTARSSLLDSHTCTLGSVNLTLCEAANRVLAAPLAARYPSPLFDNSAMDGYAVCDPEGRLKTFTVTGRTQAGDAAAAPLQAGEAVRIFTGAPLPANATAVVPQEETETDGGTLAVTAAVKPGQHIRRQAEEISVGQELLVKGSKLNAAALGLAASQGYDRVPVYDKLSVIVFSSGNEITEPGMPLENGRIYDANRYLLISWLQTRGAQVMDGGILPDDLNRTETALAYAAKKFDVIITSGGASVGEADYLKQAIENTGSLTTHTLAIKPGKPFAWGHIGNAKVFVLPGNPVAAFVTAHLLLLPVLNKLMGKQERNWTLPKITAKAVFSTRKAIKRREFLRVRIQINDKGETQAVLLPNQGSAMLGTCVTAEALCEIPAGQTVGEGDTVTLYLLPG